MKRVLFRSILLRYIISYAAVMAVVFVGVGIYVSNIYSSVIHDSIVEENTNRLSALRMQHEEKLTSLFSITSQMSFSNYIVTFRLEENPMKAYILKQQLASYNVADDFFDQLYIIFHDDHYLYSSNTTVSLDMFTEDLMHYENVSSGMLRKLLKKADDGITFLPSDNIQSVLTSDTNKQMATIILPLRLDGRYNIGNAVFLIEESVYQRMFADEIHQQRNMYIFYGEEIISATRPIQISDETILQIIAGQKKSFTREIAAEDGTRYLLFVQQGKLLDIQYVSLITLESV